MGDLDEYVVDGARITVCKWHQQEFCHKCGYDFSEINNEERRQARMKKGANRPYTKPPGGLAKNTRVMMEDRSGSVPPRPLYGTIKGRMLNEDEDDINEGLECYIIECDDDGETVLVPIEDVAAGEWKVVSTRK